MKTLKQITLGLAMIILTSGTIMAGSFKSLEVKLSNGKTFSILTKVEELVEESIPGYQYFVNQYRNRVAEPIANLPVYEEELLEEKTPSVSSLNTHPDMVNLNGLLAQIKPEETLLEEDIDTHVIFVQYQKEIQSSSSYVNIENFVKEENELDEELPGTLFLTRSVKYIAICQLSFHNSLHKSATFCRTPSANYRRCFYFYAKGIRELVRWCI